MPKKKYIKIKLSAYVLVPEGQIEKSLLNRIHEFKKAVANLNIMIKRLKSDETGGLEKNQPEINLGIRSLKTLKKEAKLFEELFSFRKYDNNKSSWN